MTKTVNKASSWYWNDYYASSQVKLLPPSQFAAFIASEVTKDFHILDVGCGNGRDSLFFSSQGYKVVGIDRSDAAIDNCRAAADARGLNAGFHCAGVDELPAYDMSDLPTGNAVLVYARFFLHALPEELEDKLLTWIVSLSEKCAVRFAAEFRTDKDASLPKSTSEHYRRYINPNDFLAKLIRAGFKIDYSVEGFGFAKYKNDDAHVARFLVSL